MLYEGMICINHGTISLIQLIRMYMIQAVLCFVLLGLFSLPLFECFPALFFLLLLLSVLLYVQCAWCLCAWSKILEAVPVSGCSRDGCCL